MRREAVRKDLLDFDRDTTLVSKREISMKILGSNVRKRRWYLRADPQHSLIDLASQNVVLMIFGHESGFQSSTFRFDATEYDNYGSSFLMLISQNGQGNCLFGVTKVRHTPFIGR